MEMTPRINEVTVGFKNADAMSGSTVATSVARGLLEFAASKGAGRAALAEHAGIDLAELQERTNRIPFTKYVALMRAAQTLCRDPALALHLGESCQDEMGVACVIGMFAETAAEGLSLWNRYAKLNVDVDCEGFTDRFVLRREAGQVWLVDTRLCPNEFPELTEITFVCMVSTARRYGGTVRAIHVTHAPPPCRAEYDRILRLPLVFESDRNALLLSSEEWMRQRSPSASPVVLDVLSSRAEAMLEALETVRSTKGRVESLLLRVLHTGDVSVDSIAAELAVSRQTLFRRLKAEGTTFERVLDDLRRKMALHYLREKKLSVGETAYLVGFSDRAAFTRAFKRWTGSSPGNLLPRNQTQVFQGQTLTFQGRASTFQGRTSTF
jgi:AraC-like DNA-binding protein